MTSKPQHQPTYPYEYVCACTSMNTGTHIQIQRHLCTRGCVHTYLHRRCPSDVDGCISVRDATCLMALIRLRKSLTTLTKSRQKVRMVDSVDFTSLSGTGEVCIHDVISPYRLSGFRQRVLSLASLQRPGSDPPQVTLPPLPQQPPRYLLLGVVFTQGSEMMRCSHPGSMGRNEGPCLGKWGILDMNSA